MTASDTSVLEYRMIRAEFTVAAIMGMMGACEIIRALHAKSKKLLPKPPTMPEADAQPPVRGSGTHSLNFRKTIRERFPAADFR
jgi:hypothetical protein